MTSASPIPPEILARIILEQLRVESLPACLSLRLVSRYFDQEVVHVLIEEGIFDSRFFRYLHRYAIVHDCFALRYFQYFVRNARKQNAKSINHNVRHSRRRRDTDSESPSEVSSKESDPDSDHSEWTAPTNKSTVRTKRLQGLFTSAVVMLITSGSPKSEMLPAVGKPTLGIAAPEEHAWILWTNHVSNATIALMGARDSLLFIGPRHRCFRHIRGERRHFVGKVAGFYALIGAVQSRNFLLSCHCLEQFRIVHTREALWLQRLDSTWDQFAWNSAQKEKVWLEVLAACLILAIQQGNTELFHYLIDLEPGIFTAAFTYIRFHERNVIEEAIALHRLECFQVLADRGWCLYDPEGNWPTIQGQYRSALICAIDLDASLSERFEILRVLLIMSREWQRNNNFRLLLLQAAKDDDVQLAQLMLDLIDDKPIKWSTEGAADFERNSRSFDGADVLDVAEMNGSVRMVRFLLQHRKRFASVIDESRSYINPRRAVRQIIRRGEPSSLASFKEIVFAARDQFLGPYFIQAAGSLSTEVLAILAEHIDPDSMGGDDDDIDLIEEDRSMRRYSDDESIVKMFSIPRPGSPARSRSSYHSLESISGYFDTDDGASRPTRGECALASALRSLKWRNARFLVEKMGVKLSWGSVKGIDVGEMDESGMEALVELRKLLAEHGMSMETKMIYAPIFHPGQAASNAKPQEHDVESIRGSSTRRTSSTVS